VIGDEAPLWSEPRPLGWMMTQGEGEWESHVSSEWARWSLNPPTIRINLPDESDPSETVMDINGM
jgi:hypothetical protein